MSTAAAKETTATTVGSGISVSLLLSFLLGVIALCGVVTLFALKNTLGPLYFGILYYLVYPIIIYLLAVGFNAISQVGSCNEITNIKSCFTGAVYPLGYLYMTMSIVNLVGPNGIWTFEEPSAAGTSTIQSNIPLKGESALNMIVEATKRKGTDTPIPVEATKPQERRGTAPPTDYFKETPLTGGGHRQTGGVKPPPMSDGALMIRSFFTTLRAPAMSLFIRDPNAATLEAVETKSPIYTGIGVGYWVFLATISGQIISNAIAQKC